MSAHAPRDASLQMQVFNMDLTAEIERNVSQALAEDIGTGDLTANLLAARMSAAPKPKAAAKR